MSQNSEYWVNREQRAERAKHHTFLMQKLYGKEIAKCAANTILYDTDKDDGKLGKRAQNENLTHILVSDKDTVSAIFDHANEGRVCALNFASFKNPGGAFLRGSRAQEECLCHESFLYNVLSVFHDEYYDKNKLMLNRSLYQNRALYSPGVRFHRRDKEDVFADVITCAAPNKTAAQKYCNVSDEENRAVLFCRIDFVLEQAAANAVDTLILGAYGCGVFGQNPDEVFEIFSYLLRTKFHQCFKTVVFAVPNSENNPNYAAACKAFA